MALEDLTGTKYIDALVSTNPVGATDPKSEGDDHLRGLKNVLKLTFPNINAAVTADPAELNYMDGITAIAISILAAADAGAVRTLIDAEQADADILKSDTSDNLTVGFTTDIYDHGSIASETVIFDLTVETMQKTTIIGDVTFQIPASGNGFILLKTTNGGSGPHTVTLSAITVLSGTRNSADAGVDLWRLTVIDGAAYAEIVNIS